MVHLPKQKILSLPRTPELCDVAGDFRGADNLAFFIFDRRNCDGNINKASVLVLSYRLVMVNPLTPADTFEDHGFFVVPVGRYNHGHGPADGFVGRVAKKTLGPAVPTGDHAVEVFGKDCVIRRFYDRPVVLRGAIARWAFAASAPRTGRSSNNL